MFMGKKIKSFKVFSGLVIILMSLMAVRGQTVFARAFLAEFDCESQTSVSFDECQALVAIYNSTGGDSWSNSTGWLTDNDVCAWHGVLCSEGHIVTLDLFNNNLRGNLPLEIGGFPFLRTLTLNDNPLTGPIPVTITFMDLDLFHFHGTSLCEPADPVFQDWFSQIVYRLSSGLYCSTLDPRQTPNAQTQTAAADLPWPQQTLTAMANSGSRISTATPEATPTRYYSLETPTQVIVDNSDETDGSFGGVEESESKAGQQGGQRSGFLSNIPSSWMFLLLVPLVLIVVGIILELRDRKRENDKDSPYSIQSMMDFTRREERSENQGTGAPSEEEEPDEPDYGGFDMYDFDPK